LRLTWSDIDEEEGVITPSGGRKKTGVRQVAPLTDAVRSVLAEIRAERKKLPSISPLVFLREDARPVNGDMKVTALRNACKAANVSNFTFHDTRHTAKTAWARAGIPVEAAMLAAGHASVQMHQAYVHLQQSDIARAFKTSSPFYSSFTSAEKQVSSSDAKS
jgi:integrase